MDCEQLRDERLDVLYGEADVATRGRVEAHLLTCETCRQEMDALRWVRGELKSWTLPEGRGPSFVAPRRSQVWLPLAAGFLIALGAGLLLRGAELRHDKDGFALTIGRSDTGFQKALAEQESRALAREEGYRREIESLKASVASAPALGDRALLAEVEERLRASEARQGGRLETSLVRLDEKQTAQRRYDMARIAAGLSYLDGRNGQHVARTTELMGYVLEAASQKK
jgi:hypothetical protein